MGKYKNIIIYIISAIILFGLAVLGYNNLTKKYFPAETENKVKQEETLKQATDFNMMDLNGNQTKLSDYFGKPIVVNFWATWCGPCKIELPAFDKLHSEYKDKIEFLMVNLEGDSNTAIDEVKKFVNDNGYSFPLYFETNYSATNAYYINSIPSTLFINNEGKLVKRYIGAMSEETLKQYLDSII